MVAIKTSFTIITLVMTSVIDRGLSDEQHEELCTITLKQVFNDKLGPYAALDNFKKSYKMLSLHQIKKIYGGPQRDNESDEDHKQRKLLKRLVKGYFISLICNHGLRHLQFMKNPNDWCLQKESTILELSSCVGYIVEKLFGYAHPQFASTSNSSPLIQAIILRTLYEKWSHPDLNDFKTNNIDAKLKSVPEEDKPKHYTYYNVFFSYYNHYELMIDNLVASTGNFKSVPEYCKAEGQQIVINTISEKNK